MKNINTTPTPKDLYIMSLSRTNLINNDTDNDWQVEAAWAIFELFMRQNGYILTKDNVKIQDEN